MTDFRKEFNKNADEFDTLMTGMLAENDYLKCALDTISSGFGETKQELENYAEQKLIDTENGVEHRTQDEKIAKYEDALNRIITDCTARKAILIATNALKS
ncbi:MAG: hypothetical protein KAT90_11675 [Gammaproteobacteria bacterium]|nr:hypothetical protein [Gammaproteobacteria bacterium]